MKNSTLSKKGIIKLIFISLSVLMSFNSSTAQTNIGGVLSSDTTLLLINSPYIVTNNLLVQQGVKVTVEPGVIFKFNQGIYLQVDGEFRAIGTNTDSIIFTKNTTATSWGGVHFTDSSSNFSNILNNGCILDHCRLEFAVSSFGFSLLITNCSPKITNSNIQNSPNLLVYSEGSLSSPEITNNKIHNTGYVALEAQNHNWGLIQGNEIYNSSGVEAVFIGKAIFTNNYVHNCSGGIAVRVQDSAIINNNIIENNSSVGLAVIGGDAHIIKCNTFENNGTNMVLTCERHPLIINNNFFNYQDWNVYWDFQYGGYANGDCHVPTGSGTYATIDFSSNYWGGLTNSQMDSSIWDFSDDFSLKALIDYSPTLTDTVNYSQVDCSYPLTVNEITIQNEKIEIYPNPFHDNAYLRIRGHLLNEKYQVTIINLLGNVVKNVQVTSSDLINISGDGLSSGMYFCQIVSPDKKLYSAKLIVQ